MSSVGSAHDSHASAASSSSSSVSSSSSSTPSGHGKRRGYLQLNLEMLLDLFAEGRAKTAPADSSSSSSSSSSAAASSSSSSSASSSSPPHPLPADVIKSVFDAQQHDMQLTLNQLIEISGGLHSEMHSDYAHSKDADTQSDDEPAAASSSSTLPTSSSSPSLKKQKSSSFHVTEVKGDLFSCAPTCSLAHCVSVCLAMGKGIATLFKNKFGGLAELKTQNQQVGGCAVLRRDKRFVYYLITKPRYFHKPTYGDLERSLVKMREHMQAHGVKDLAIPRLGCGLDGLLWAKVREILEKVFEGFEGTITCYSM